MILYYTAKTGGTSAKCSVTLDRLHPLQVPLLVYEHFPLLNDRPFIPIWHAMQKIPENL